MPNTEPGAGAPASNDSAQTTPTEPTTPTTPAFESKDGVMSVDGRKVVYESDLIAAKESLRHQAEEAQTAHNGAIDKAGLDLSGAQQQLAAANAKVTELEQARESGVASAEEVARVKQELETAKGSAETATAKSLEYRRQLISTTYHLPVEQLSGKTIEQLDSFEEALKAVSQTKGGVGAYAVGGATATAPEAPLDRARRTLEEASSKGHTMGGGSFNHPGAQQQK